MMRPRIYIAGPIAVGDRRQNVMQAEEAAWQLIEAGFAVLCPHLSVYLEDRMLRENRPTFSHSDWLANDLAWVAVADAVLRLPGYSPGDEQEVACAAIRGIPVFGSVAEAVANRDALASWASQRERDFWHSQSDHRWVFADR